MMMKDYKFVTLMSAGWEELKEHYIAWAGIVASIQFLYFFIFEGLAFSMGSIQFLFASVERGFSVREVLFGLALLLAALLLLALLILVVLLPRKYFLTLARQPRLVQKYFLRALWYGFSDGLLNRIFYLYLYSVSVALGLMATAFLWWLATRYSFSGLAVPVLLVILMLASCGLLSFQFLVPYIIQDTYSNDNQLQPLPYYLCRKKSLDLMYGQKENFIKLCFLQILLTGAYLSLLATPLLIFAPQMALHTSYYGMFWLILVWLVKSLTIDAYFTTVKTLWANDLMEQDEEIVDFGD